MRHAQRLQELRSHKRFVTAARRLTDDRAERQVADVRVRRTGARLEAWRTLFREQPCEKQSRIRRAVLPHGEPTEWEAGSADRCCGSGDGAPEPPRSCSARHRRDSPTPALPDPAARDPPASWPPSPWRSSSSRTSCTRPPATSRSRGRDSPCPLPRSQRRNLPTQRRSLHPEHQRRARCLRAPSAQLDPPASRTPTPRRMVRRATTARATR